MTGLFDHWQRQINYLRVSITDRCNLRCVYCSAGSTAYLPREEILSYEEIARVVNIAAGLGIKKVRLTGGEPLVRPEVDKLVTMLAGIGGIDDISLTTNGIHLARYATALRKAGLRRVNVSLDTLKADRFSQITGGNNLSEVLSGIDAARRAALEPVKINVVVLRGVNDDETTDFANLTRSEGWHVRFIEYMPFDGQAKGPLHTVPTGEVLGVIGKLGKLVPYTGKSGNGPARYFQFEGARGTVGFITAVTEHFCSSCNRLRLTADGHLRPCLLDDDEVSLKEALRNGTDDEGLAELIKRSIENKRERHHLGDGSGAARRPMRQIGG